MKLKSLWWDKACWVRYITLLLLPAIGAIAQRSGDVLPRPRIGLVLEGDDLGLAYIGILQWLEDHRIPVDYIAGPTMAVDYATGLRRLLQHGFSIADGLNERQDVTLIHEVTLPHSRLQNEFPVDAVKRLGANIIIVAYLRTTSSTIRNDPPTRSPPRATNVTLSANEHHNMDTVDVLVTVDVTHHPLLDSTVTDKTIAEGYNAAEHKSRVLLRLTADDTTWRDYLAQRDHGQLKLALTTRFLLEQSNGAPVRFPNPKAKHTFHNHDLFEASPPKTVHSTISSGPEYTPRYGASIPINYEGAATFTHKTKEPTRAADRDESPTPPVLIGHQVNLVFASGANTTQGPRTPTAVGLPQPRLVFSGAEVFFKHLWVGRNCCSIVSAD